MEATIPSMSHKEKGELHLRRIDPAQNMRRFYTLAIQPTLFGGASLMRYWGRIGTNGQAKIDTYEDPQAAKAAYWKLELVKRRRGYKEPEASKDSAIQVTEQFSRRSQHASDIVAQPPQTENADD